MLVRDLRWTFVAYQLLELRDDKESIHGVSYPILPYRFYFGLKSA